MFTVKSNHIALVGKALTFVNKPSSSLLFLKICLDCEKKRTLRFYSNIRCRDIPKFYCVSYPNMNQISILCCVVFVRKNVVVLQKYMFRFQSSLVFSKLLFHFILAYHKICTVRPVQSGYICLPLK